jgi:hypothetical protein
MCEVWSLNDWVITWFATIQPRGIENYVVAQLTTSPKTITSGKKMVLMASLLDCVIQKAMSFMPYATCNCICLIMDAMFSSSALRIEGLFDLKNLSQEALCLILNLAKRPKKCNNHLIFSNSTKRSMTSWNSQFSPNQLGGTENLMVIWSSIPQVRSSKN